MVDAKTQRIYTADRPKTLSPFVSIRKRVDMINTAKKNGNSFCALTTPPTAG